MVSERATIDFVANCALNFYAGNYAFREGDFW